jgi:hypothetical protein
MLLVIEPKMCAVVVFAACSEIFLVLRRNDREMIKMYIRLYVKYPLFLSNFNENLIFSKCLKKHSHIKFNENPSIESRDGRLESNSHLLQFCERA